MDAASGRTKLSAAVVSPRTGTPATTIAVAVVYQNANGSRAEHVDVSFGGLQYEMARDPGGSWGKGVTFRWSGTLPVGRHAVVISAEAKDNSEASLAAGTVTIAAPVKATPEPTPKPTPKPTAAATPKPPTGPAATAAPTPTATATAHVGAFVTGLPIPTAALAPEPTPAPTDRPTTAAAVGGSGPGAPTGGGADGAGGTDGAPDARGGPIGGDSNGGWGPIASVLAIAGLQGPTFPGFGLVPTLVTATGAVTAVMALSLFGRRRRDDDPPDDVLSAAAGHGVAVASYDAMGAGQLGLAAIGAAGLDADMEALLPRWRRPSLLQARKADPIRDATPAPRLTFDEGLVGSIAGHERRLIRYRVVRLLDSPDELRGTEIGYLDQGDEVQLIEKYGAYCLVIAPDGQQGWLHKMTLGEVVDGDGAAAEGPTASMPTAAESWTMAEADIDSDVLEAYLESRRRNA